MPPKRVVNKIEIFFEFYVKGYENGYSGSILLRCVIVCNAQAPNNQNTCYTSITLSSILNSLLWSGSNAIINTYDTIQNPFQTHMFYKHSQTCLTRTKCDPNDSTQLRPWFVHVCVCVCPPTS